MARAGEVIIVGGGIIGLSVARELIRAGFERITVLEKRQPARAASWAAAGMLAPNAECEVVDDFYRFCDESRQMYPEFAEALLDETGVDVELDRSGTLYAAFNEADASHLDLRYYRQKAAGIPVERLSFKDTIDVEPMLSPGVRESLYFPNDWQVENRALVTALEKYVLDRGVAILSDVSVDSVIIEGSKVTGVNTSGGRYVADVTVLATGAWTSLIQIGSRPMPVEVRPIRGQMLSFRPEPPPFRHVIYSPRGYLVPRADGRILIGATVEDVGFDDRVTPEAVVALRNTAYEIAPFLEDEAVIESWSGLRPFAADGLPILGPVDGFDALFIATAHYRNGILLAPITALLLARLIAAGESSEYFNLFGTQRVAARGFNAVA